METKQFRQLSHNGDVIVETRLRRQDQTVRILANEFKLQTESIGYAPTGYAPTGYAPTVIYPNETGQFDLEYLDDIGLYLLLRRIIPSNKYY